MPKRGTASATVPYYAAQIITLKAGELKGAVARVDAKRLQVGVCMRATAVVPAKVGPVPPVPGGVLDTGFYGLNAVAAPHLTRAGLDRVGVWKVRPKVETAPKNPLTVAVVQKP